MDYLLSEIKNYIFVPNTYIKHLILRRFMKKLILPLVFSAMAVVPAIAESFSAGGETYTYTVTSMSTPGDGVKYTRMRFTAPSSCNVSIAEIDLTNENVRVEAWTGSDGLLKTEKMTTFSARKTATGLNPVVVQNGHFWSMSSQTGTSAGVHATTTCLGGCMVNGKIKTETNWANDQWNGGPSRHGILGIKSDGKAVIGNYQTLARVMCPAKWGSDENGNSLYITEINKYCIASDYMAMFTPEFPSNRTMKVLNTSAGQPGTVVSGTAIEVYLTLDAGQEMKYNEWVTATVGKIVTNSTGGTRGSYDIVLVASPGVSQSVMSGLAVGDQMKVKYCWHPVGNTNTIPDFENIIAGNAIVMQNGAITTRATDESYNTTSYARSMYGVNSDGTKLYMCVVDKGSNEAEGISYGATCTRISYIMNHFGAKDVLSCDGGGSAQMVVNGAMATKPSDGSERAVASGMVVYSTSTEDPGTSGTPEVDTYEEVTPLSGSANPYAFEVTGSVAGNMLTVNYVLNTAATGVSVVLKKNGSEAKRVALDSSYRTEAAHTATVDLSDLPAGDYTWAIEVSGETKSAVQEFKSVKFNHPQGVDTDRNFESPYFGRIYVTEGRATTSSTHYSYANGGQGLYMFTPRFVGIQNWITGKYVYTGGVTFDQTAGTKSGADFRKVRVADDGRIFLTRQNDSGSYLLEVPDVTSVVQNNATFTDVFSGGTLNATTYAYENGGIFISAPNIGFDVKGSGESLTLAMLSGQATMFSSSATSAGRLDQYTLGSKANWNSAAAPVSALTGKYTVNYSGTNICYDNRGGIWYCQYRQAPSESQPALIYVSKSGEQKYIDVTTPRGGGGIRFNPDFTQIAIASSESTFSIYNISYSSDDTPTLDEVVRITHGMGKNINDIAWDLANNIYAVSNNGEILKAFSVPRADNVFATEAATQYGFTIESSGIDLSDGEAAIDGYEIVQKWEQTEGHLTANTQSRWATAFDGKIYVNDHSASKLYYWTEDGLTDTGMTSAAGTAITSDDAGNIVVSTSMYGGGNTAMKVLPAGGSAFQDLSLTMPDGVAAAQMQYLGKAIGNIMNSEGGALYLFPSGATSVAKIIIRNGVQESSTAIAVSAITADGQSVAVPLTSDIESDDVAARARLKNHFYHNDGASFVAYPNNGITSTAGGTIFTLGDVLYAVEPVGTSYCDGFQIVDLNNDEVVATHEAQLSEAAVKPNANCIIAEPISEKAANIYQYVPGQLATMYTFTVNKTTGVDEIIEAEGCVVVAGKGVINVLGDVNSIEVYNASGVLISRDETEITCAAGIYLVRVDGKIEKVAVK